SPDGRSANDSKARIRGRAAVPSECRYGPQDVGARGEPQARQVPAEAEAVPANPVVVTDGPANGHVAGAGLVVAVLAVRRRRQARTMRTDHPPPGSEHGELRD